MILALDAFAVLCLALVIFYPPTTEKCTVHWHQYGWKRWWLVTGALAVAMGFVSALVDHSPGAAFFFAALAVVELIPGREKVSAK